MKSSDVFPIVGSTYLPRFLQFETGIIKAEELGQGRIFPGINLALELRQAPVFQPERPGELGKGRAQRLLPLRLGQEIQALPRPGRLSADPGETTLQARL